MLTHDASVLQDVQTGMRYQNANAMQVYPSSLGHADAYIPVRTMDMHCMQEDHQLSPTSGRLINGLQATAAGGAKISW